MLTLYKNIASGKNFIHLDSDGGDHGLFINPEGTIIELEYSLFFEDPIDLEDNVNNVFSLLNEKQINRYKKYMEKEKNRKVGNLFKIIESLSTAEIELLKKWRPICHRQLIRYRRLSKMASVQLTLNRNNLQDSFFAGKIRKNNRYQPGSLQPRLTIQGE